MTLIDLGRAIVDTDEVAAAHFHSYGMSKVLMKDGREFIVGEHFRTLAKKIGFGDGGA